MDKDLIEIIGYHGTCSNFINNIEKYGLDPEQVRYRKDHWLGQGVYFFEEWSKSMWWANDISGKPRNRGSFPVIYKSSIVVNESEFLNLDNPKEADLFYDRILENLSKIEADSRGRYPVFTEKNFRAVYFDYYKKEYGISVIKYTFPKDSVSYGTFRSKVDLEKQRQLTKALGVFYKETQICVSKKTCITDTIMVYNGEDEVI